MTRWLLNRALRCAALTALVLTAVFSTTLAAAPNATKPDCSNPRDYEALVHCFLGQFRCLPAYFGIDGKPDYPKALSCFVSYKLWKFAALMYLNGEGTPRDLKKATAALKAWKNEGPDEFDPHQAATLKRAIDRCRRHPRGCSRIDYCKQLCEGTQEIEICQALDELTDEAAFSHAIATTKSNLSPADRVLFDRSVAEFKGYQLDDMQRQYQAFIDASLRDVAGADQAGVVRENFMKLMANTIQARRLEPAAVPNYVFARNELERELHRNVQQTVKPWEEILEGPGNQHFRDSLKSDIEDYEKAAQESQAQWIKFRDSCVQLATSLYRDRTGNFDAGVSMKVMLTRNRIAELRSKPFGPQSK